MAEEQRCQQAPEGHHLCANNCGFFGSSATLNLCSKCYRDFCLKEEQASSAKFAVEKSLAGSSSSISSSVSSTTTISFSSPITLPAASPSSSDLRHPIGATSPALETSVVSQPNRCSTCRKRVGLTGFRCKCGITFCSSHRYPEQHGCTFDFKSVGREAIAKANPIVIAEKLEKI